MPLRFNRTTDPVTDRAIDDIAGQFPLALSTDNFTDEALTVLNETSDRALMIVRGIVTSLGAISEGTGFTVDDATGPQYGITFDPVFSDIPAITITSTSSLIPRIDNASASSFDVTFVNESGSGTNGGFHFIAIGPR